MLDFEELRIRVRRTAANRYLVFANGQAHAVRTTKVGTHAADLRREAGRLADAEIGHAPRGRTHVAPQLRSLGQSVFDLLFDAEFSASLRDAQSRAEQHGRGLRLRFDLPPELQALPVEALRSPSADPAQSFVLNATLSIARSLTGGAIGGRLPSAAEQPDFIRLLVAIASPADSRLPRIDSKAEVDKLRELPELAVRMNVLEHATRAGIERWIAENNKYPAAVLLIAHGVYDEESNEGTVLLETEDGGTDRVPSHVLSGILVRAQRLRLVVLNLCYGARATEKEPFSGLAQALIGRGIPAVAAMDGPITDLAARFFAPRLLEGICRNETLDEAMTAARQRIASMPKHTTNEWAAPILFLHDACTHSWLFKAREVRDDEPPDPLRAGEAAIARLDAPGNIKVATVVEAARSLRLRHDWPAVEGNAKASDQPLLIAEARIEQAWPRIERLCEALADDALETARQHLNSVRHFLPEELFAHLDLEVSQVGVVRELVGNAQQAERDEDWPTAVHWYEQIRDRQPAAFGDLAGALASAQQEVLLSGHYENLLRHQQAQLWPDALAECEAILAIRPDGYRDTVLWFAYLRGLIAEADGDWTEATAAYESCKSFADTAVRRPHARGRAAAEAGAWPVAHNEFRAAEQRGATLDNWSGYAAARVAEQDSDWETAERCYVKLPRDFLDTGLRTHYARGRSADDQSDWDGVIKGFGELPDDFADGEVGQLRRFARASLAARREDWRSVLALLGEAADAERGGSVGVIRRRAWGRLAAAENDWATAARIYAEAADDECSLAHQYATARLSEVDADWPAALDQYTKLPDAYEDVAVRTGYAKARIAEDGQDWWRAIKFYEALPADLQDVPLRLGYARARHAMACQDWEEASRHAHKLGDYGDSSVLADYAQGRLAEKHEDWAAAAAEYEACAGHEDAAARLAYVTGRRLDAIGRWSAAMQQYEYALVVAPDVRDRLDRLKSLLSTLPWADDLATAALVADPVALRENAFPYLTLQAAGVTPLSPTDIVNDAAYLLMERGGISWSERVAWDQLRTPAKRLLVDARLYRLRDPESLCRELTRLAPARAGFLLNLLCERLPADAPLLNLLAGNRADAISTWLKRLTKAPDDLDSLHSMAVSLYWYAQELEQNGAWEQAAQVWHTALACWAALVTDDEFWISWRQARAACYGHAVTPADTARLRAELGRHLIALLASHAERHASAGRPHETDRYHELIFFLEAELSAAQCLKEAGGLPLPSDAANRLICGPEYLRMVGLVGHFAEFIASVDPTATGDGGSRGTVLRQLRCSFSSLSRAACFLEHSRFEAALRALPDHHRQRRDKLPADCAGPLAPSHGAVEDCGWCQDFLEHNSAYTYLEDRWFRLLQDAVGLAVRTRLSIARDQLASRQPARALTELASAITVSANALMAPRTREAVMWMIAGRVDALCELSHQDISRLDEAIGLVELAVSVVGRSGRTKLVQKLADLLVSRGVWYGSSCTDYGIPADATRAAADLRRAFELNPDSAWVRYNFAQGLVHSAEELSKGMAADKLTWLAEALDIVHSGLEWVRDSPLLHEALDQILGSVESILLAGRTGDDLLELMQSNAALAGLDGPDKAVRLTAQAEKRRACGDVNGWAHQLLRAARADPGNAGIRQELLRAIEAEAARMRDEGTASR